MAVVIIQAFLLVVGLLIVFVLVDVAKSLRMIGDRLIELAQQKPMRPSVNPRVDHPLRIDQDLRIDHGARDKHPGPLSAEGGGAVWALRKGSWQLQEDRCALGYEPGPPPSVENPYENQHVVKGCIRRRG